MPTIDPRNHFRNRVISLEKERDTLATLVTLPVNCRDEEGDRLELYTTQTAIDFAYQLIDKDGGNSGWRSPLYKPSRNYIA